MTPFWKATTRPDPSQPAPAVRTARSPATGPLDAGDPGVSTEGYLDLEPTFYNWTTVHHHVTEGRRRVQTFEPQRTSRGMHFQAREVQRCLAEGRIESARHPLSASIAVVLPAPIGPANRMTCSAISGRAGRAGGGTARSAARGRPGRRRAPAGRTRGAPWRSPGSPNAGCASG